MSAYRTVVVGTDGSESSFLAVEKAAAIAGDAGAKLIIACAYYPADPKDVGHAAGAKEVVERAVVGAPVESLLNLVDEVEAGLLVIGNRGLNTLTGRLLGSVPSDAARKSTSDVLIVHTVR